MRATIFQNVCALLRFHIIFCCEQKRGTADDEKKINDVDK